jgi:hypothetical protein
MQNYFKGFTLEYIEQNKNIEADDLANAVARNTPMPPDRFYQVLEDASVKTVLLEPRLINIIKGEDWRALIMAYLRHYYEPDSTIEKIRMQQWAKACQIVNNNLYKASISGPLLRWLSKAKGQDILSEVHAGIYGGHIGAHGLATKVLWQDFYWPAMIDDAAKLVSTYEACQKILSLIEVSCLAFTADHPILAIAVVGHRYRWQTHTSTWKLHIHHCSSGILHQVD